MCKPVSKVLTSGQTQAKTPTEGEVMGTPKIIPKGNAGWLLGKESGMYSAPEEGRHVSQEPTETHSYLH